MGGSHPSRRYRHCLLRRGCGGAGLAALIVPAPRAAAWFEKVAPEAIDERIAARCATLPTYARPARVRVVDLAKAKAVGLLTENGRIRRRVARELLAGPTSLFLNPPLPFEERTEFMSFYDRLAR